MISPRGSMNHLGITVRDLKGAEEAFYAPVLGHLGYEKVEDQGQFTVWYHAQAGAAMNLWQAKLEFAGRAHERYAPGFHHFAFNAESRADVDGLHALLREKGVTVLDAPAEYPHYAPEYYAVFFADPDGLKFEFVYMKLES